MSQEFQVYLERFVGPYFKLLELIEERKLSINEFSLAEITDKYLAYIRSLDGEKEKNLIDISQFITVASTLMLIKAKSLFPTLAYSEEEQSSVDDLAKKLELYKNISEASKLINRIYNKQNFISFPSFRNEEVVFVWDKKVDTNLLHSIAVASLLKVPKKDKLKSVAVKQVLKIEDVIEKLLARVNQNFSLSFQEFSSTLSQGAKSLEERKSAFIISFLAMLELIKNGFLKAEQEEGESNIQISNLSAFQKEVLKS